jgi:hypothetical protein
MLRAVSRFPSATRSQYVEEVFGADPTGVTDSTTALIAAGASGLNLKFYENGIYRLTAEIPLLAGTRFLGDGSQTFRQYTTNLGCFVVEGDDCEVSGVSTEYIPDRAYTIADITNATTAVMTFSADVPFVSGDRVRVTYQSTGMTQVNRTSPYLKRLNSMTFEMYSNSTLTTPINSSGYGAYVAGAKAALQPAGRLGFSGFQSICGVWLQGNRAVVRDFKATNFFNAATMRGPLTTVVKTITGVTLGNPTTITCPGHSLITGMSTLVAGVVGPTAINVNVAVTRIDDDTFTAPVDTTAEPAYVSGGTCTNYDNRALSSGLEISGIRAVGCDFVVTGGQYEDFVIDGVRMESPTEHTVPPHAIYLQNASTTGQTYEGFAERGTIRNVMVADYPFGRALRLSNVKDVTLETITLDGCLSGLNLSRCFRVKVIAPDIINLQDLAIGIELTDAGEDNQILGGQITGASGATFSGILSGDSSVRTLADGVALITNNGTWSSSSRRMIAADTSGSIVARDCTITHLQANTCFAFAASQTASIDFTLPKITGNAALVSGGSTATITGLYDANLLDATFDPALSTCVNVSTATLKLRGLVDEKVLVTLSDPTLIGTTTPGTHTYGAARGFAKVYRIGHMVFISGALQLTALDGTMAGDARITGLPYTVAAGATGGGATLGMAWRSFISTALNMQSLPAGHSGVWTRPIHGTTQLEIGYSAPATTGETWTPLTVANLTNTLLVPFQGVYFTDDPV